MTTAARRSELVERAILVETVSIVWMVAEAAVALVSGIVAHSVSLFVFGLNSAVELVAGTIVFAQLNGESRGDTSLYGERHERKALWAVGISLWLLSIYIIVFAGTSLVHRRAPEASPAGFAVAFTALVLTPLLGRAKIRIGTTLPNRALVADGKETLICGWLSIVTVLGIGLNAVLGWWWADAAAAVAMLPFLVREGWMSIQHARGL
ncbi:MAG: cation transporter [Polyangiaceae bacterium]|nr:cation transporter [Polyangiaceae bacterium]